MYSCTRTPTHRQNRRLPVFLCCLPARRLFSLSLTYSLLYGITKPPYNLLKGDASRLRLIHANVHARTPESLHTWAGRKISAILTESGRRGKLHSDAIPQEVRAARNGVFMAKGNRPFKYNLIGQLDGKLLTGCFTSPTLWYRSHLYFLDLMPISQNNSFNTPMIDCNIFTSTTRLTFATINVGVYDFSLHLQQLKNSHMDF